MYFFPVKINERRYFVAQLRKGNTHVHHFIIRQDRGEILSLFNAGNNWKHLHTMQEQGEDPQVMLRFSTDATGNGLHIRLLDEKGMKRSLEAEALAPTEASEGTTPVAAPEPGLADTLKALIGIGGKKPATPTEQQDIYRETQDVLARSTRQLGLDFRNYTLYKKDYRPEQLTVVLEYEEAKDEMYQATLCFHFQQHNDDVFYHILDYGSEASQIARIYPQIDSQPAVPFKMIEEMEKLSGLFNTDPLTRGNNSYLQEEMGLSGRMPHLFSSKIFLRTSNAIFSALDKGVLFRNGVNDSNIAEHGHSLLHTLSNRKEATRLLQYYQMLPNLKILSFVPDVMNNVEFDNLTVKNEVFGQPVKERILDEANFFSHSMHARIYRAILNCFIYMIVNKVRKMEDHGLLDVTLLVPNIYGQDKVAQLYRQIEEDLPVILEREGLAEKVTGFEIHILSESDASFLGMISERKYHDAGKGINDYYLVIDSGKGTTDFSILRKNADHRYDSIYRSGIPGAGNVLTYAFLETIAHALSSGREKGSVLGRLFADGTLAQKLALSEQLESIKRNFNALPNPLNEVGMKALISEAVGETDGEVKLDYHYSNAAFTDQFNNVLARIASPRVAGSVTDEYGYIKRAVESLAEEVIRSLKEIIPAGGIVFNKVYLSGRAFLFAPYRAYLEERLLQEGMIGNKDALQSADNLKEICIKGSVDSNLINFDSGIIGLPWFSAIFNGNAAMMQEEEKRSFWKRVRELFNDDEGERKNVNHHLSISDKFFYKHADHNIDLRKYGLNAQSRVLRFKIGRYYYSATFPGEIYLWNLLFNGNELVFKDMEQGRFTVIPQRLKLDDSEKATCYRSLAPYINNPSIPPPLFPYEEKPVSQAADTNNNQSNGNQPAAKPFEFGKQAGTDSNDLFKFMK
jgi:hypothetical protein